MVCSKSYWGRYASPALAAASYPFVDLPSGDTLRCKLFPADKFYKVSLYFDGRVKQKKQAEKEALDPDANYTEDKGDFEIPMENEPEETSEENNTEV